MSFAATTALTRFWAKCKARFAEASHTHDISDTTDLQTALDSKAAKTQAVKSITRSGTTYTATRCDGTTFTFTAPSGYTDEMAVLALQSYAEQEGKLLLSSSDYTQTEKSKLGKVQAATTENAYVTFVRSSWSTSSDTSTLPVTPCFVYSTGDGGLYYCS